VRAVKQQSFLSAEVCIGLAANGEFSQLDFWHNSMESVLNVGLLAVNPNHQLGNIGMIP
jgi:hypothetical protein